MKNIERAETRVCLHSLRVVCRRFVEQPLTDPNGPDRMQRKVAELIERAEPQCFACKVFRHSGLAAEGMDVRAEIVRNGARIVQ